MWAEADATNLLITQPQQQDNRIVYGGGAAEISASIAVAKAADTVAGVDQVRTDEDGGRLLCVCLNGGGGVGVTTPPRHMGSEMAAAA